MVEDLGSGCLTDLKRIGITGEPSARESLQEGADIVCFSADKLLGGPQAGIIAGKEKHLQQIRRNPLFRALRLDKLTLAALQETLISYVKNRESTEIPLVRMIQLPAEIIGKRAEVLAEELSSCGDFFNIKLVGGLSMIGGGSSPEQGIPTRLLSLQSPYCTTTEMEGFFRLFQPPVLCRVERDCVLLDLRTVFPEEDTMVLSCLKSLANKVRQG